MLWNRFKVERASNAKSSIRVDSKCAPGITAFDGKGELLLPCGFHLYDADYSTGHSILGDDEMIVGSSENYGIYAVPEALPSRNAEAKTADERDDHAHRQSQTQR